MVNLSDTLLMVAVAQNLFMGPAQLKYRLVESPFEQVITVKNFQYSPIKKNTVQTTIMEDDGEFMYSSPDYGFLTLTNNWLFKHEFSR
uniref:Vitellogenin n=1 Tax=Panagrolaimus davidi TaxID=227884 RepID=A0A914PC85_9BILA